MIETAYLLQSVLIVAWWVGISLSEAFYGVFEFPGIDRTAFSAFLIPDIAIIAALSVLRGYRSSRDIQLIILGAFFYATLFCVNANLLGGGGFVSTLVMATGLGYNVFLCYGERIFRVAAPRGFAVNALKTCVQILCIWFLTLVLVPYLILRAFGTSLLPLTGFLFWMGTLLFVLCSLLGLTSSYILVRFGKGTPLPLDQTNELVVNGPYRYVRNPMAVAGIGQGLAIGMAYGSWPILFYAVLGAVIWHLIVRPFEERDLLDRFGGSYEAYRSRVRCWLPRFGEPH